MSSKSTLIKSSTAVAGLVVLGLLAAPAFNAATSLPVEAKSSTALSPMAYAPSSFAPLVEKVRGAVVSVQVRREASDSGLSRREFYFDFPDLPGTPFDEFFKRFKRAPGSKSPHRKKRRGVAQGSGFIISADGYIVTNNHVVKGGDDITVTLDNGKKLKANTIGVDKKTDLALLKVKNGHTLPYVEFSDTEAKVGDWVVAVGNPFGLGGTVTVGVVSARGRDIGQGSYDDFLQIDAPINKGNSGGPTFNLNGKVVGINTAIFSRTGGSVGIGFAIPASQAREIITDLKQHGGVTRGWLGVAIQKVTEDIAESLNLDDDHGVLVSQVTGGSPADKAGLRTGDVILDVDGRNVRGPRDLARKIAAIRPGVEAKMSILRSGSTRELTVKIGTLSDSGGKAPATDGGQSSSTGFGLQLQPATDGKGGVMVAGVDDGSQAEEKHIAKGDRILEINNDKVNNIDDFDAAVAKAKKDGKRAILMLIQRGKTNRFVGLSLSKDGK
ncbi:MAG: hypothetical protein C0605_05465 [Hyphomicrobiales bacterium]|nr:MAG: hypothetical protein C0605_05465 [Hyphomicrobiales bacterium]